MVNTDESGQNQPLSLWFSLSHKKGALDDVASSDNEDNEEWVEYFFMNHHRMDNLSWLCETYQHELGGYYQGDESGQCCNCPVALAKILRGIKLIVVGVARSYYARTVVLLSIPFVLGIGIGFIWGRITARKNHFQNTTRQSNISQDHSQSIVETEQIQQCTATLMGFLIYLPFSFLGLTWTNGTLYPTEMERNCSSEDSNNSFQHIREDAKTLLSRHHVPSYSSIEIDLTSQKDTLCESGVLYSNLPRHIAVIMDGNRRYGKAVHGSATAGHEAGGRKVMEFAKWCLEEKIKTVTMFAFSTENWKRDPSEVASIMSIFVKHCQEIMEQARPRNIRVRFISTHPAPLPDEVRRGMARLEQDTNTCTGLSMNICLSYGSRDEIVQTCRLLARECINGTLSPCDITESSFAQKLFTQSQGGAAQEQQNMGDPDILIRTSGELRLSNFLLWQLAYSELFFVEKAWPQLEKGDFIQIIRSYASGRQRRYGK